MQKQIDYTEILVGLRKIIRAINLESKQIQKEYGISIPQLLCLSYLRDQTDEKATSSALKSYMNLNASTISGITSRLEKKGYLRRLPHAEDKRVSILKVTTRGLDVIDKIPPLMHDKLKSKLQQLSASKLKDIQDAIQLLVNFMGTEDLDASPVIMVHDPTE